MAKFTRQGALTEMEQPSKPSGDYHSGKGVSKSFNHAQMGKPLTGRQGYDTQANTGRYQIFGNKGVGSHFTRSGSPGGKSPRV